MTPQKEVLDLEFHPLANLFPLIEGEEFDALVRDIKENGIRQPIVLFQGKILDGRNRYRAAKEAGIDVCVNRYGMYCISHPFTDFKPKKHPGNALMDPEGYHANVRKEALDFVLSTNLHRRHLTDLQRAAIAADIANMRQGARTDLSPSGEKSGVTDVSQSDAAKMLNTSKRSVERAAKRKKLDPEGHEAAKAGKKVSKPRPEPSSVPKPTSAPIFPNEIQTQTSRIIKIISEWSELDPNFNKALDLIEDQIRLRRAKNQGNIEPEPEPNQATLKVDELNKIAVIKWLMLIAPGLGLADSKQIVEEAMGKANKLSDKEVAA